MSPFISLSRLGDSAAAFLPVRGTAAHECRPRPPRCFPLARPRRRRPASVVRAGEEGRRDRTVLGEQRGGGQGGAGEGGRGRAHRAREGRGGWARGWDLRQGGAGGVQRQNGKHRGACPAAVTGAPLLPLRLVQGRAVVPRCAAGSLSRAAFCGFCCLGALCLSARFFSPQRRAGVVVLQEGRERGEVCHHTVQQLRRQRGGRGAPLGGMGLHFLHTGGEAEGRVAPP